MIKVKINKESNENDTTDWWDEKEYENEKQMIKDCFKRSKGNDSITITKSKGFFDYIVMVHDMEEKHS